MHTPTCTIPGREAGSRRIIVVEPDPEFRERMVGGLVAANHMVSGVPSAIACYQELAKGPFDLAVIDAELPDQDGFILARYLRSNTQSRILLFSADESMDSRLKGYDAGADLYLAVPFDLRALAAAAEGLLQRLPLRNASSEVREEPDGWVLLTAECALVSSSGIRLQLTPKEQAFLGCLARYPGDVVSRPKCLARLGYGVDDNGSRSLDALVYRLRKKFPCMYGLPLKTISGAGFSFAAPIETR
jgi:DNA-binding response OmpR family regulator